MHYIMYMLHCVLHKLQNVMYQLHYVLYEFYDVMRSFLNVLSLAVFLCHATVTLYDDITLCFSLRNAQISLNSVSHS